LHTGVVDAYANALAPAFWYIVPVLALGFVLTLFLREVKLSSVAGMVARGEAVADHGSLIEGARPAPVQDRDRADEVLAVGGSGAAGPVAPR